MVWDGPILTLGSAKSSVPHPKCGLGALHVNIALCGNNVLSLRQCSDTSKRNSPLVTGVYYVEWFSANLGMQLYVNFPIKAVHAILCFAQNWEPGVNLCLI